MTPKEIHVELLEFQFCIADQKKLNSLVFDFNDSSLERKPRLAHLNLHGLYLALRDKRFGRFIKSADFIWLDGFSIIWLLNRVGYKVPKKTRVTFLDWQNSFFETANERKLSIFLLGSEQETIGIAASRLKKRYPQVDFNFHSGYFNSDKSGDALINQDLNQKIRQANANIVLVGMGMPRQEFWIEENCSMLSETLLLPVGGYFDYIAEKTKTPNRALSNLGLEWLIRLINEPRRLAHRYLVEPWFILFKLLQHKKTK